MWALDVSLQRQNGQLTLMTGSLRLVPQEVALEAYDLTVSCACRARTDGILRAGELGSDVPDPFSQKTFLVT